MWYALTRMFPAYTPEMAREAALWVWRDLAILTAAGHFEVPNG